VLLKWAGVELVVAFIKGDGLIVSVVYVLAVVVVELVVVDEVFVVEWVAAVELVLWLAVTLVG